MSLHQGKRDFLDDLKDETLKKLEDKKRLKLEQELDEKKQKELAYKKKKDELLNHISDKEHNWEYDPEKDNYLFFWPPDTFGVWGDTAFLYDTLNEYFADTKPMLTDCYRDPYIHKDGHITYRIGWNEDKSNY